MAGRNFQLATAFFADCYYLCIVLARKKTQTTIAILSTLGLWPRSICFASPK